MSRLFYQTMQDNAGNLLFGVSGTMRLAGTGTLATIYGDEGLTIPIANPMTNHPSFGSFKCYLGPGNYDFYMAKAGYTFETLTGLQGGGTMNNQDASNVTITGGTADLDSLIVDNPTLLVDPALNSVGFGVPPAAGTALRATNAEIIGGFIVDNPTLLVDPTLNSVGFGVAPVAGYGINANSIQVQGAFVVDPPTLTVDPTANSVGFGVAPIAGRSFSALNPHMTQCVIGPATGLPADTFQQVWYQKASTYGMTFTPTDNDTGPGGTLRFQNTAGTLVGSVTTTAAATSFNTASDSRLKTAVQTLVGELAAIRALRPVRFRWLADDSEGVGFLASEVQEHVQGVVTGEADAVDAEGHILPQQIDHSKLVPWLVGALQTLAVRVETLTERVAELEAGG